MEEEGKEEQGNNDDGDGENVQKCCFPTCVFANMPTSPPIDECQGACKIKKIHHARNVNWLESNGVDAELSKICFDCVCSKYTVHQI